MSSDQVASGTLRPSVSFYDPPELHLLGQNPKEACSSGIGGVRRLSSPVMDIFSIPVIVSFFYFQSHMMWHIRVITIILIFKKWWIILRENCQQLLQNELFPQILPTTCSPPQPYLSTAFKWSGKVCVHIEKLCTSHYQWRIRLQERHSTLLWKLYFRCWFKIFLLMCCLIFNVVFVDFFFTKHHILNTSAILSILPQDFV